MALNGCAILNGSLNDSDVERTHIILFIGEHVGQLCLLETFPDWIFVVLPVGQSGH